jgi:hypothetical protein
MEPGGKLRAPVHGRVEASVIETTISGVGPAAGSHEPSTAIVFGVVPTVPGSTSRNMHDISVSFTRRAPSARSGSYRRAAGE